MSQPTETAPDGGAAADRGPAPTDQRPEPDGRAGPPPGGAPAAGTDTATVLALLLGIGGLVFCPLLGLGAWWYANSLLAQIRAGRLPAGDHNLVVLAKVLGVLGTLLMVAALLILLAAAAGVFTFAFLAPPAPPVRGLP